MKRNATYNVSAPFEQLENRRMMSASSLDPTFDSDGIHKVDLVQYDNVRGMTTQPDGKTLVVENTSDHAWMVSRFDVNGSLDSGFGTGGTRKITFGDNPFASGIAVQPNGNIIVVGSVQSGSSSYLTAARLTSSGKVDTSFGYLKGQYSGKSGTGSSYFELDVPTFYGVQKAYASAASGIAMSGDGSFYIGGTASVPIGNGGGGDNFMAAIHVSADGKMDYAFGQQGVATQDVDTSQINAGGDHALAITRQPDGKLLLAGASDGQVAVERFNANGSVDYGFGSSGGASRWNFAKRNFNEADTMDVGPDGKIVVAGNTFINGTGWVWAVSRLTKTGYLDSTFNLTGMKTVDLNNSVDIVHSVKVMADGKILAAGVGTINNSNDDFTLARFNQNGSLDGTFGFGGFRAVDLGPGSADELDAMSITPTGRVTVAGVGRTAAGDKLALARFIGHSPTFSIYAVASGHEGGLPAQFKIVRDGDPWDGSYDLSLLFSGTAIKGTDYTVPFSGKLHWNAGQSTRIIDLAIVNDAKKENYESIRIDIGSDVTYDVDSYSAWTQTGIYDND